MKRSPLAKIGKKKAAEMEAAGIRPVSTLNRVKKEREKKTKADKKAKSEKVAKGAKLRSIKAMETEATELARRWSKRHGQCEAAGFFGHQCSTRLEWAHIKSRSFKYIKYDPKNQHCLCWTCHFTFTNHPDLWTKFVEEKNNGRWDYLNSEIRRFRDARPKITLRDTFQYWIDWYKKQLELFETYGDDESLILLEQQAREELDLSGTGFSNQDDGLGETAA